MYYGGLRAKKLDATRADIIGSLQRLRAGCVENLPAKKPGSVLLATWNIREFGGTKGGGRTDEALYCIAELISKFDIVAVQEVRADLAALDKVMALLGRDWDRVYTDIAYSQGGNGERFAFLWDRTKVRFTGLAGELVLPKVESETMSQISRTPFICGFQVGWAKFNICAVHIYYGQAKAEDPRRVDEIKAISTLLKKKAQDYITIDEDKIRSYSPENLVLLGDFNVFKRTDATTFKALEKNKFVLPKGLEKETLKGSNADQNKFYDQIVFFEDTRNIENTDAGVFNFYDYVFRPEDAARFVKQGKIADKAKFKDWRTYQMSDHLVMWTEFVVDRTDDYLAELAKI